MNVCQSFDGFKAAAESALFVYPRPYGIWHKGEPYWSKKLPRKPGSVVRIAEDDSGGVLSLMVWDLDGTYLCNAWPLSWCENEHPAQIEAMAEWNAMTPEERKAITDGEDEE